MLAASNPKDNTSTKGELTECMVLTRLVQLGYKCLIPWGHDHRYDIAIDNNGELIRVQCKTLEPLNALNLIQLLLMPELGENHT
jgi:hypothetical protein